MIVDHAGLADHIARWIKNYVASAHQQGVVLGLSGGIDSALVALLCLRGGTPVHCVNMPCHSSSSAFDRAAAFASDFGLPLAKVDLSAAHEVIVNQFDSQIVTGTPASRAALRSCLRAPTLSYFAHSKSSLIVGTGNRSEDRITRYFQKYGDGCVDFSPIADLFKSEVYDLFRYLGTGGDLSSPLPQSAQNIYRAKPTADLWGEDSGQEDEKELGITYDEIEWCDREDALTDEGEGGVIFISDTPRHPLSNRKTYSNREEFVIQTLRRLEQTSRHKANPNLPVCEVRRTSLGLVK